MKKQMKIQKKLFFAPIVPIALLSPLAMISCSNNQQNEKVAEYDQYYQNFYNSLVFKDSPLYFEMFGLSSESKKVVGLDVVGSILSLSGFESNDLNNQFVLEKEGTQLKITYNLFDKNNQLITPSNSIWKTKVIDNVKTLTNKQFSTINEIKDLWKNNTNIEIYNSITSKKLENKEFVVASSLSEDYFSKSEKEFVDSLSKDQKETLNEIGAVINFSNSYDDLLGSVSISLDIVSNNNLHFLVNNDQNQKLVITGFTPIEKRKQDILDIFKNQLSKSYDLKSDQFKDAKLFASSIYNEEVFTNFLKQYFEESKLPDFFVDSKKDSLWYELKMSTKASDRDGNLSVDFKIVNKFTREEFKPSNISTSMFFFNFTKLAISNPNNYKEVDYSIIENIYNAYQLFSNIKLNDDNKFMTLPSNNSDDIDWNWLKTKTNLEITNNDEFELTTKVKYSWEGFDLKERTNKFRFKKVDKPNIIDNDILGTKSVTFLLEMEYEVSEGKKEWLVVLPPESKEGSSFSNYTAHEKYLNVGNFRNKNINDVNLIYDAISKMISIEINDVPSSQLEEFQKLSKKEILDKYEYAISVKIDEQLTKNNIQSLTKEYSFVLDTLKSKIKNIVNDKNRIIGIEIEKIEYNVVPKNNKEQKQEWYKDNSNKAEPYPEISFRINFRNN